MLWKTTPLSPAPHSPPRGCRIPCMSLVWCLFVFIVEHVLGFRNGLQQVSCFGNGPQQVSCFDVVRCDAGRSGCRVLLHVCSNPNVFLSFLQYQRFIFNKKFLKVILCLIQGEKFVLRIMSTNDSSFCMSRSALQ